MLVPHAPSSLESQVSSMVEPASWRCRIGACGLSAVKQRRQEAVSYLTPELDAALDLLLELFKPKPRPAIEVTPQPCDRFVVASDAVLETHGAGAGGFLVVWFNPYGQQSEGSVADISAPFLFGKKGAGRSHS